MTSKCCAWRLATMLIHVFVMNEALSGPVEISSQGMSFVVVDQPGNPADMRFGEPGRGAIDYMFSIGKYEVTVAQWVEFLNAKATNSDGYYLLRTSTTQVIEAQIAGTFRYASQLFKENQPVRGVDWFRAARFANWMHNGKGNGSTEVGVYDLNGQNIAVGGRNADSLFWIPTIDEWHKAAYFNGDNSDPLYWTFATQSDITPTKVQVDPFFNGGVNGEGNFANFNDWPGGPTSLANVGTTGGASAFGAYDMSGNVSEIVGYPTGPYAWTWDFGWTTLGGDCNNSSYYIAAGSRDGAGSSTYWYGNQGFRLAAAAVPEPSSGMAMGMALATLFVASARRRNPFASAA